MKLHPQRWDDEFDFEFYPEDANAVLNYIGIPKSKVRSISEEKDEGAFREFQSQLAWEPEFENKHWIMAKAEKDGHHYLFIQEFCRRRIFGPATGFKSFQEDAR